MACTLKGSGVSFTGSLTKGGVAGDGAAQAANESAVITPTSFKLSEFLSIVFVLQLLSRGVFVLFFAQRSLVRPRSGLLVGTKIARLLFEFSDLGFVIADTNLLPAQHAQ